MSTAAVHGRPRLCMSHQLHLLRPVCTGLASSVHLGIPPALANHPPHRHHPPEHIGTRDVDAHGRLQDEQEARLPERQRVRLPEQVAGSGGGAAVPQCCAIGPRQPTLALPALRASSVIGCHPGRSASGCAHPYAC